MRYLILILIWINVFALSAKGHMAPATDLRDSLVHYAKTLINTPYRSGSKGPNGFDCSGFTSYVYSKFGIPLKASSGSQITDGQQVPFEELKQGDLVFFKGRNSKRSRIGHVAIFLSHNEDGSFNFIHSANGGGVRIDNSSTDYYAKRLVAGCAVVPQKKLYTFTPVEVNSVPMFDESPQFASNKVHKVKKGESLYTIAKANKVTEEQLKEWNNISSSKLKPGQKITIQVPEKVSAKKSNLTTKQTEIQPNYSSPDHKIHLVRPGESFYSIAKKYNITEEQLKHLNNYHDGNLNVGDELTVPSENAEPATVVAKEEPTIKTITTYQTHKVRKGETLSSIAQKYGTTTNQIKQWNSISTNKLKPGIILTVKEFKKEVAVEQTRKSEVTLQPAKIENTPTTTPEEPQSKTVTTRKTHKVRQGETLSTIAEKYGTTTNQLKQWNGISKNKLKPGTVLTVKEVEKEVAVPQNKKTEAKAQPVRVENTPTLTPEEPQTKTVTSHQSHKVKKGETLSSIAQKYGATTNQLKRWNGISKNKLKPGTYIIVQMTAKKVAVEPAPKAEVAPVIVPTVTASNNSSEKTHQVTHGETLYSIAKQHNITALQLKQWNNLTENQLKEGDVLSLQPTEVTTTAEQPKTAPAIEPKSEPKPSETVGQNSPTEKIDTLSTSYTLNEAHEVQPGETLESIASQYKVTTAQIKQWNGISRRKNTLTPGQKLIIKTVKKEYVVVTPKKKVPKKQDKTQPTTKQENGNSAQTQQPAKYIVKKGETLYSIAKDNNLTVEQLKEYNSLTNTEVKENQAISLTPDSVVKKTPEVKKVTRKASIEYLVKPGDTLYNVAKAHNVTVDELKEANSLINTDVNIGQHLIIPTH